MKYPIDYELLIPKSKDIFIMNDIRIIPESQQFEEHKYFFDKFETIEDSKFQELTKNCLYVGFVLHNLCFDSIDIFYTKGKYYSIILGHDEIIDGVYSHGIYALNFIEYIINLQFYENGSNDKYILKLIDKFSEIPFGDRKPSSLAEIYIQLKNLSFSKPDFLNIVSSYKDFKTKFLASPDNLYLRIKELSYIRLKPNAKILLENILHDFPDSTRIKDLINDHDEFIKNQKKWKNDNWRD